MVVMEAYTSFNNTMKYYKYGLMPFNFQFITKINSMSTALDYKQEIDAWMSSMPQGQVANWVVCICMK